MPEANLTVRIKAIDEATPIIKRVQGAAKAGASAVGGGIGKASAGLSQGISKEGVMGGLVGGMAAGGIMAGFSMLQNAMGKIVEIGKKLYSVMSESSGYLKVANKMWDRAIMEIFRPMGDMLGMTLMPSLMDLNKVTRANYAKFLENIQNGMSVEEAMAEAMKGNTEALGEFLSGLAPALEPVIDAMVPLVTTAIQELAPVMAGAFADAAPSIGAALYEGLAQGGIKNILQDKLGLEPNSGADWLANDPWGHSTIGQFASDPYGFLVGRDSTPNSVTAANRYGNVASGGTMSINYYGTVYGSDEVETSITEAMSRNMDDIHGGGY